MSILKVDITNVSLFFRILYVLVNKVLIYLRWFTDMKFAKTAIVVQCGAASAASATASGSGTRTRLSAADGSKGKQRRTEL